MRRRAKRAYRRKNSGMAASRKHQRRHQWLAAAGEEIGENETSKAAEINENKSKIEKSAKSSWRQRISGSTARRKSWQRKQHQNGVAAESGNQRRGRKSALWRIEMAAAALIASRRRIVNQCGVSKNRRK